MARDRTSSSSPPRKPRCPAQRESQCTPLSLDGTDEIELTLRPLRKHGERSPVLPQFMAVREAVIFSGLSRSTLYVALKSGALVGYKVGKRRLIGREELIRFIRS